MGLFPRKRAPVSDETILAIGTAVGATINAFFNYLTQHQKGKSEELGVTERVGRTLLERVHDLETQVKEQHDQIERLREDLRSARTVITLLRRRRRTQDPSRQRAPRARVSDPPSRESSQ